MGESWVNVEIGQVLSETNNGEGDCLFAAISQQLEGQLSSAQLRQMAVDYLSAHRIQMEEELLSLGWEMIEVGDIPIPLEGEILIDAVLRTLINPRVWGGAECIAALSLSLNREIRVYQEGAPTIIFSGGADVPIRILLRYPQHGASNGRRTHYESVLHWRARPVITTHLAAVADAVTQTDDFSASATTDPASSQTSNQSSGTAQVCIQQNDPQRRRWSDCTMVLRARPDQNSVDSLRVEPTSDEEVLQEDAADAMYGAWLVAKMLETMYS